VKAALSPAPKPPSYYPAIATSAYSRTTKPHFLNKSFAAPLTSPYIWSTKLYSALYIKTMTRDEVLMDKHNDHVARSLFSTACLCLLLVACGGGGGGSTPAANNSPTASFVSSQVAANNSLNIRFNAANSSDNDGTISSYSWDFGDGNNGSGVSPSHLYSNAGSYTISLTVTDNDGASNSSTSTLELTAANAQFSISRASSQTIRFDGTASSVDGAVNGSPSIVSYSWDFGDGSLIETDSIVEHSYTGGGSYSATLTVTDSSGDTDSESIATTFSVSGTVSPANNTAVDIDVNDPSRQNRTVLGSNFVSNNNSSEAQALPNPVLLNGFVNAIPAGEPLGGTSNFQTDIDQDDVYSVYLLQGQFVSIRIADFNPSVASENDIDLYLYDSNSTLINSSTLTTETESVIVPADGQYFILVNAYSGISKYLLNIGNNSLASGARAYGNGIDIIPGEAIVKTKTQAISAFSSTTTPTPLKGLSHNKSHQRSALMSFDTNAVSSVSTQNKLSSRLQQKNQNILQTLRTIKQLNQRVDVEYAEPNYRVKPFLTPNDNFYQFQWHYPQINLPQAWDITTGTPSSGSVVVAVVDSGVALSHSDLAGQLTSDGFDFIRDADTSNDLEPGIDNNPNDPGDGEGTVASSWHGTHVAGTIAAATNNGKGVAGVSWGAKIMPIRALGKGGGSSYDVAQGIRYAAGLSNDSGQLPNQAASIINLSLGGTGFSQSTQNLFTQLYNNGIIVIAAAGNESSSIPSYPASYSNVISVSATDLNNNLAPYSNFGNFIDIAAPGGDASKDANGDGYNDGVLSTLFDEETNRENYAFYQGTSMATPHVAGVAALMKAIYPDLTADDFRASLQNGELTNDLGTPGRDNNFGYGIIDALKAVQQAQILSGGNAAGSITATPNRINFGAFINTATLNLSPAGQTPPDIVSVNSSANWLTIDNSNANADGTGEYLLTADRNLLIDEAIYSETITVQLDNGDQLQIPLTIQVASTTLDSADSGFLFLLLLDADSYDFVDQVNIDIVDGVYEYRFNNIPFGEYVLIGGSDIDNDFIICGVGESCGNYPINGQPFRILVDSDLDNLNFLTSMESDIISSASTEANTKNTGYQRIGSTTNKATTNKQLAP
jgi:serine protease